MSNVTYNPYSGFALHHMGVGPSDGIQQGAAGQDQVRTALLRLRTGIQVFLGIDALEATVDDNAYARLNTVRQGGTFRDLIPSPRHHNPLLHM